MRWQIIRGVAWQGGATVVARFSRSLAMLVLGGLLSPAEFGSFAAIYVVVDGLHLIQELGLPQALVVRRERIEESANSTFLLALALGVVFASVGWLVAPAVASFYGDPALVAPFRVLSLVLLLHAPRVVPLRLFERDLDFKRKFGPTALGAAGYIVASVAAASFRAGVWSLVIGVLTASAIETIAFWLQSSWRPGRRVALDVMKADVRFGLPVVAAALLTYLFFSMDRVVLGRAAGAAMLGAYAFALTLATLPASVGSAIINSVLLPSYGSLGTDPARRRELHLHAVALGGGFALAFAAPILCVGSRLLDAVYGSRWEAGYGALSILAVGAVFRVLSSLAGEFLVGAGRPAAYRAMTTLQLIAAAVAIGPCFLWQGAAGVAIAMSGASVFATATGWWMARDVGIPLAAFASALRPALIAFGVTLIAARGVLAALPSASGLALSLAIAAFQVALFGAIWWRLDVRLRRALRPEPLHSAGPEFSS